MAQDKVFNYTAPPQEKDLTGITYISQCNGVRRVSIPRNMANILSIPAGLVCKISYKKDIPNQFTITWN